MVFAAHIPRSRRQNPQNIHPKLSETQEHRGGVPKMMYSNIIFWSQLMRCRKWFTVTPNNLRCLQPLCTCGTRIKSKKDGNS